MISDTDLLDAFLAATAVLDAGDDSVERLDSFIRRSAKLFDSVDGGILLKGEDDESRVVAATSARSLLISSLQVGEDEGPCLDALQTGEVTEVVDIGEAFARWPKFSAAAGKLGYHSMYAVPLGYPDLTVGSLNLFFERPGPLPHEDAAAVKGLAAIATIGILSTPHRQHAAVARRAQEVIDSRVLIEQARGIIAERDDIDLDASFTRLQERARREGTHLVDAARGVVASRT